MAKTCKAKDCKYPVFGKGYCKFHQHLRTDKKPKKLGSYRSKLDRVLKKQTVQNDISFYMRVWSEREHRCYNCSEHIPKPALFNFDHILEKQAYPQLRHEPDNICILCLECHGTKTNGILSPKLKELREKTKKRFDIL